VKAPTQAIPVADDQAAVATGHPIYRRIWWCGALAAAAWLAVAELTERWPDNGEVGPTMQLAGCMATIGVLLMGTTIASVYFDLPRLFRTGPWLVALALLLGLWELASAKLNLLPRPFFAAPQSLLEVYTDDWLRLADSTAHSLMLLVTGYVVGAVLGQGARDDVR
jgi:NitT/TauT family transport system permease protein